LKSDTAPVKLLPVFVNVIAFAPAVKLDVPETINAPFCVMPPVVAVADKLPTLDAANNKAMLSVTAAVLLEPLLETDTAPVKLLPVVVNVIAFAPAVKLDVPETVNAPFWVMPPVV
jgi:hypothetical protein